MTHDRDTLEALQNLQAARVDTWLSDPSSPEGRAKRVAILEKIRKWGGK